MLFLLLVLSRYSHANTTLASPTCKHPPQHSLKQRLTSSSNSFVTTSVILEGVGTSAYLGGAPLLQNKDILTTAGAILVTEALHTSQQRGPIGLVPAANDLGTVRFYQGLCYPNANIDQPVDANSIFTLASGFIAECPAGNAPLPFKANAKLTVDTASCPAAGAAPPPAGGKPPGAPPAGGKPPGAPAGPPPAGGPPSPPAPAKVSPTESAHHSSAPMAKRSVHIQTGLVGLIDHNKVNNAVGAPAPPPPPAGGAPPPPPAGGNGGKVTAAQPCPFLSQGQEVKLNGESEIPQGSFVTFVSGLSVTSVQGSISGQSASASVPAGIMGQSYVFVTNKEITDNKLAADAILMGPAILEGKFMQLLFMLTLY